MTTISTVQTPLELPPILGDFIDACVANKFIAEAPVEHPIGETRTYKEVERPSTRSELWVPQYQKVDEITGKKLSEDDLKSIKKEDQLKKEEYLRIKSELPPYYQTMIDDLSLKFDTVKKIAEITRKKIGDPSLEDALKKQSIEPLEAVTSCASYINHLAVKMSPCSTVKLMAFQKSISGTSTFKDLFITTDDSDEEICQDDLIIRVKPETEFYLAYGGRIYHIEMKRPNRDGTRTTHDLENVNELFQSFHCDNVALLQSKFDAGEVNKNTLLADQNNVLQIPIPKKISSFITPCSFWEKAAFDTAKPFFATLINGSQAKSILPDEVVNSIIRDYIVDPSTT